jgi:hypothetical protein
VSRGRESRRAGSFALDDARGGIRTDYPQLGEFTPEGFRPRIAFKAPSNAIVAEEHPLEDPET